MKRQIILLFLFFFTFSISYADITLPKKVNVWQPSAFSTGVLKVSVAESVVHSSNYGQSPAPDVSNRRIWVVYSDRDNNHVYENPSPSARQLDPSKDLKMNERLRIADIKNGYALVYEEPRQATSYPDISDFAVSRGWVPMDHLVLWRTCPADEFGIYRKALLALNADKYKKGTTVGHYYKNPQQRTGGGQIMTGMNFYYVMKVDEESGLTLLSNEYNLDLDGDHLYGWVDEASMLPWNQRSCLEPNWNSQDVSLLENSPAYIYGRSDMSTSSVITTFNYGKVLSPEKVTPYRMDGKVLRYPILDSDGNDKNSSYKCTYFGTIGSSSSLDAIATDITKQRKEMDYKLGQMEVLNIIIAIDGTKSMEAFYEPVQQAVVDACAGLGGNYTPRVGLVIYRDYADGKDDPENGLVEYVPLCEPGSPELAKYFREGGLYHVKSSKNDRTFDEAVYNGIWTALDMDEMGYTKEQSNLLVVIGDCGNDPTYEQKYGPTKQAIVDKLVDNRVHLLVFQVHKEKAGDGSNQYLYESNYRFTDQMNDILLNSMENKYQSLIGDAAKVRWTPIVGGYDLLPPKEMGSLSFYMGATRFPNNDEGIVEIKAEELNKMLLSNIFNFASFIDKVRSTIIGFEPNIDSQIKEDEIITERAKSSYFEEVIGKENVALAAKYKTLVTVTGYTPKKSPDDIDYWKPVIFISKPEFDNLIARLEEVLKKSESGGSNTDQTRRNYVVAMKEVLRSMLPGITEQEMEGKTQEEIVALVAGLNVSTRQLSGRPLREISDKNLCSDREFNSIISAFKNKLNKLRNDAKDRKAYIYDYLEANCYWVPIDDLP